MKTALLLRLFGATKARQQGVDALVETSGAHRFRGWLLILCVYCLLPVREVGGAGEKELDPDAKANIEALPIHA